VALGGRPTTDGSDPLALAASLLPIRCGWGSAGFSGEFNGLAEPLRERVEGRIDFSGSPPHPGGVRAWGLVLGDWPAVFAGVMVFGYRFCCDGGVILSLRL